MTREQASNIIAGSRRFPVNRGRIVVRESELANMIAAVKADRRPGYARAMGALAGS